MSLRRVYLFILILPILSCENDEIKSGTYTKSWTLDLAKYLNASYQINGTIFESCLLPNGLVLVNEYSRAGGHLVELDPQKGEFLSNSLNTVAILNFRKKVDETLLVTGLQTLSYRIGSYNPSEHIVEFTSTISKNINEPSNITNIFTADNAVYTHNPSITLPNTAEVYLAKWDFSGNQIWRKIIDPTKQDKISSIQSATNDHIIFISASNYDSFNESWKVGKVSIDGNLLWHKQLNTFGYINQVVETENGDLFILNKKAVTKHDQNGNLIWSSPVTHNQSGYISGHGVATKDNGIMFQYYTGSGIDLIKINERGKVDWTQQHWEETLGGIFLLELPNKDIIVTSLKGFITKYKYND